MGFTLRNRHNMLGLDLSLLPWDLSYHHCLRAYSMVHQCGIPIKHGIGRADPLYYKGYLKMFFPVLKVHFTNAVPLSVMVLT